MISGHPGRYQGIYQNLMGLFEMSYKMLLYDYRYHLKLHINAHPNNKLYLQTYSVKPVPYEHSVGKTFLLCG